MANGRARTIGRGAEGTGGSGWRPTWKDVVVAVTLLVVAAGGWYLWQEHTRQTPVPLAAPVTAAISLPAQGTGGPQVSGDAVPALVEFSLDNTLSGFNREILAAALTVLPTRDMSLAAPMQLDALIQQQFGVTRQMDIGLYDLLSQHIRGRSEVLADGSIAAGTARVPQLTPFVADANALSARFALGTGEQTTAKTPQLMSGAAVFASPQKPATTSYLLQVTTGGLRTAAWQVIINAPNNRARFRYIAKQFAIGLGGAPRTPAPMAYAAPADLAWRQRVQAAPRDVRLFIFDTCWPDAETWVDSRRALDTLASDLRKVNGLPRGRSLLATGSFPPPNTENTHCREVAESLSAFKGLSPRVHPVYVPMTRDQQAADVISEILWLNFALERLAGNTTPAQSLVDDAVVFADAGVKSQIGTVSDWADGNGFMANSALLGGVFRIADQAAKATATRYFVNESWTTRDTAMWQSAAWPKAGFVVAAVGNTSGVNVNTSAIAFSGLAADHKSGLAVMTMDANGAIACSSSQVTLVAGDAGAVGYAGDINGHCASSFAAPRVSWILSAWESLRPTTSTENYLAWRIRLRKLLEPAVPPGMAPQEQHFLFDPKRFFVQ